MMKKNPCVRIIPAHFITDPRAAQQYLLAASLSLS